MLTCSNTPFYPKLTTLFSPEKLRKDLLLLTQFNPAMKYIALIFFIVLSFFNARAGRVEGTIKSTEGEPLAFTTIQVNKTEESTISNVKGEYRIDLPAGSHTLIFRFMGYKTVQKQVVVWKGTVQLDITMTPQTYLIGEFSYEGGEEDESYAIMRKAIALAKIHRLSVQEYTAKFYVKGTFVLEKIPWILREAMEKEDVELTEGTTYVSESVNEVEYKRPNSQKQRVISSRSNLPAELDEPSLPFVHADFYRPKVGDFVSPVHPSAFSAYDFKYEGTFQDGENQVVRIKVTPKRKGPNRYSGHINLVEPSYAFHSLNLSITDDNKVDYRLKQVYAPFNGIWMPVSQQGWVNAKTFGVEIKASYVTSTTDYEITASPAYETLPTNEKEMKAIIENEETESQLTNKEARRKAREFKRKERKKAKDRGEDVRVERLRGFEVDSNAQNTPDSVWNELRQIPLTEQEEKGYAEADSLQQIRREKEKADSTARTEGFKWHHTLTGGTYEWGKQAGKYHKAHNLNFEGALGGLSDFDIYNTVDGFILKTGLKYTHRKKDKIPRITGGNLRYAFEREALNGDVYQMGRLFNDKLYYKIEAGKQVSQINGNASISNLLNLGYTWLLQENYLKLYEKEYAALNLGIKAGDRLTVSGSAEIARRFQLNNNSFRSILNDPDKSFSSNTPDNLRLAQTGFKDHTILLSALSLVWRPFAGINIYNEKRYVNNSNRPKFTFTAYAGHFADEFYRGEVTVDHKFNVGLIGDFKYKLTGGSFVGETPRYLIDYFHFAGNQTALSGSFARFRNLDYFKYSSQREYFQGFAAFEFKRLALTQIGKIKMLGWEESLFFNHAMASQLTYTEGGYRLSGIFRTFGVDVYAGFFNGRYDHMGVRAVLDL